VSGLIQWALATVEEWCDRLGLMVNPDKTGLVVFTRNRKLPGFFEPYLFGRVVQHSMSVKYLGVILDSRLTWKEHVNAKVKKAQNSLSCVTNTMIVGNESMSELIVRNHSRVLSVFRS
jgi:hypothetical protein